MADTSWANTKEKKRLYGKAQALGADNFVLSDLDSVEAFLEEKEKHRGNRLDQLGAVDASVAKVIHWQGNINKTVEIPYSSTDLWTAFNLKIAVVFNQEIGMNAFKLYSFSKASRDLNERTAIKNLTDLLAYLSEFASSSPTTRKSLYVYNSENNSSPNKLPDENAGCDDSDKIAVNKNLEFENVSSVLTRSTTRNSTQSSKCKIRDYNTCIFCGYGINDSSKREACHILEINAYDSLPSEKERFQLLENCDLADINSLANLISLCKQCHRQFDNYHLSIHPEHLTLLVAESIRGTGSGCVTQGNILFNSLHGKKIIFNGIKTWRPSTSLLEYRHNLFVDELTKRGFNSLYCPFCPEIFTSTESLQDHEIQCKLKQLSINPKDDKNVA